jgi:hypothetical protein
MEQGRRRARPEEDAEALERLLHSERVQNCDDLMLTLDMAWKELKELEKLKRPTRRNQHEGGRVFFFFFLCFFRFGEKKAAVLSRGRRIHGGRAGIYKEARGHSPEAVNGSQAIGEVQSHCPKGFPFFFFFFFYNKKNYNKNFLLAQKQCDDSVWRDRGS